MLNTYYNEDVTLNIATNEIRRGVEVYETIHAKAIITTLSSRDVEIWGNVDLSKVFIVNVNDRVLELPLEIIHNNKKYTVKQIKECRSVNGSLVAHRIYT